MYITLPHFRSRKIHYPRGYDHVFRYRIYAIIKSLMQTGFRPWARWTKIYGWTKSIDLASLSPRVMLTWCLWCTQLQVGLYTYMHDSLQCSSYSGLQPSFNQLLVKIVKPSLFFITAPPWLPRVFHTILQTLKWWSLLLKECINESKTSHRSERYHVTKLGTTYIYTCAKSGRAPRD